MPFPVIGTNHEQVPTNAMLGGNAFTEPHETLLLVGAVYTLEQLRGTPTQFPPFVVTIRDATLRGVFFYDSTDTTSNDDGKDTLVTNEGYRYKRRNLLRGYTPTSGADTTVATSEITYDVNGIWVKTGASTVMLAQWVRSGNTASRPATSGLPIGYSYYDLTIGKPIWWNGAAWKDATNTTV